MYWPDPNIKSHPERRWAQTDRAFFGYGACHILAGTFLDNQPVAGFYGEWIVPSDGFSGTHIYVTNGTLAFDYRGYTLRQNLISHHWRKFQTRYDSWDGEVRRTDFGLLDTQALNQRNHRGPDQYFGDPIARAKHFIAKKRSPEGLRLR